MHCSLRYLEHPPGSKVLLLLLLHFDGDGAYPFTLTPRRAVVALPTKVLPIILRVIQATQTTLLHEGNRVWRAVEVVPGTAALQAAMAFGSRGM